MPESWASRVDRFKFNLYPAYRGTGGRITYIADDYREIRIALPLSWRTRNYVGTIFGGSMYAAVDPIYMVMLIKNLGAEYVVWDKAAAILFKRPGKTTLNANFILTADELTAIKSELQTKKSFDRVYRFDLKGANGKVHAIVEKTIYIARKDR